MLLALLVCCAGAALWFAKSRAGVDEFEELLAARASDLALESTLARIDRFTSLAKFLASSEPFKSPADYKGDEFRFSRLSARQANFIATYDGVNTWLQTELGPQSPFSARGSSRQPSSVWQLTRGLPLRIPRGALLARSRRQFAEEGIAANHDILHIAELDSRGRVVFLVPYQSQLRLEAFDLTSALQLGSVPEPMGARIRFHESVLASDHGTVLSIAVAERCPTGRCFVVITLGRDFLTSAREPYRSTNFGLFDSKGDLRIYSGKPEELISANRATDREPIIGEVVHKKSVLIDSLPYTMVALTPRSSVRRNLAALAFGAILTVLSGLITLNLLVRYILRWVVVEQLKLGTVQKDVDELARGIAHNFRNGLSALQHLGADPSALVGSDQRQRFDGALISLSDHTEQMRSKLATAFDLPEVPGGRVSPKAEAAAAYLAGTLEDVANRQSPILGAPIRVVFDAEFDSDVPFVAMNSTDLESVMSHLISNSIEACRQVGTNTVSLRVHPILESVNIQVVDDGCGIRKADQNRIFESGYSTKGEGRGHGLASCQDIVRASHATLALLDSEFGRGTTMELRVGRRPPPPWFVNQIEITGGSVIVVVDDEAHVGDFWEQRLSQRLKGIGLKAEEQPRLIRITKPELLKENSDNALEQGTVFLIDYKFAEGDGNN